MTKTFLSILAFAVIATACNNPNNTENSSTKDQKMEQNASEEKPVGPKSKFVGQVEKAHNKPAYDAEGNVQFDLVLSFGGNERLNGTITMASNSTGIKIKKKDGSTLVYNGKNSYLMPDTMPVKGKRFEIFTWPYFFALPYKLSDPGTIIDAYGGDSLGGGAYEVQKLTFEENTGDSPDDWYVLYADKQSHRLEIASYIVTLNKSVEEAEKEPHAIKYSNYREINGIPIAHKWSFWGWNPEDGLTKQLGEATISNVSFPDLKEDFYSAPEGAKKIP